MPFFQESGGGVTLSGGEVMCQQEFAGQVLRRLHRQGVHTAIETNLCFPIEDYRKLRPEVDLMMFDLKSTQEEAHRRYTGVSNEQILFNVKALSGDDWREMPLIARTPVVPGFNDTEEEISAIAARLTEHRNLLYYELLAYHPLGINKKAQLGEGSGKSAAASLQGADGDAGGSGGAIFAARKGERREQTGRSTETWSAIMKGGFRSCAGGSWNRPWPKKSTTAI